MEVVVDAIDDEPEIVAPTPPVLTPALAIVLALGFAVGIALRVGVLRSSLAYVDVDEAAVGLQARNFFTHPAVFFPGQPYGGALEAPASAVLARLGADGPVALKLVPISFHLAACGVAWRVAVRVVPTRIGQLAVPLLLWCAPAYGVWASTKAHGFYGAAILVAAALPLLALRLADDDGRVRALALGVALGLACWTTPLLATVALPTVAWLAVRRPQRWRVAPWTSVGAVVGAAPWLAWNAVHGWASLEQTSALGTTAADRLGDGVEKVPQLIGFVTPWAPERTLVPGATGLAFAVAAVLIVVATLRTRRTAPFLLPALVVGYFVVYPLGNVAAFVGADLRYLYPLLPALALTIAAVLPDARRVAAGLAAVVVVAAASSWWGLAGMAGDGAERDLFLAAPGLDDVVDRLEELGVPRVLSDGAGYQITFATDGRIEGTAFAKPRFPALERIALVEEPSTYVVLGGPGNARFEAVMNERGIAFVRERHGVWALYRLDAWLPPWESGFRLIFDQPVPRPEDS